MIEGALYGPDPVNITYIDIKCNHGELTNLVDIGLSTYDSHCPSTVLDDVYFINNLIDTVSTDPVCNYRNMDNSSDNFNAINEHFKILMG